MNNLNGPLAFDAVINDAGWNTTLTSMERRALGLTSTVSRESSKLDREFARLGQLAAGYFSFQALSQLPAQILQVRGEFQQLEIAFSTMLKSKTKADALLNDLVQTAASTPFGLKDIAGGAKQLLAYGSSAGSVVKELRMLGDVASGVSAPINEIIYLYGTLRTQGRAYATDIRQFAGRGIPIYQELAKVLGVNVDEVNKFVESGKVGFKEVEAAFRNMTSAGGLFAGLMDAQSKSLLGLKERLSDAWDVMLNEIGKKNEGVAAELLTTTTEVVEHYQDVVDILKVAVSVYGSYRAALLLVSVAQRASLVFTQTMALQQGLATLSGTALSASQLRLAATTSLLQRAQAALNATMLANPFVLVGTALAALVTYAVLFEEETTKLKTAQSLLAESGKEVESSFNKQRGEITGLIGVVQNQNVAESERLKAYEKLKSIAPDIVAGLDFQRAKTADLTATVNQYLVALRKRIQLESGQSKAKEAYDQQAEAAERLKKAQDNLLKNKNDTQSLVIGVGDINGPARTLSAAQVARRELDEAVRFKKEADKVVSDVEGSLARIYSGSASKEELQANIDRAERVMASTDKMSLAYKQAEDSLTSYRVELARLNQSEKGAQAVKGKTIEQLEAEIKLKKESLSTANSDGQNARIRKEIDQLEAQKRKLTGDTTAAERKAQRDADKRGPYGSVAYWESIAQKADEILSKTPSDQTAVIAKQNAIKLDAEERAEAARRLVVKKSFAEEIDEKKSQYELYQRWVTAYGKEAADQQFGALIQSGQSYLDYLNAQITKLEAQREKGTLTEKDSQNLGSLLGQRDEITGKKTSLDLFNEGLVKAQKEAGSLSEYLTVLKQKQEELNATPAKTGDDFAIRRQLAEAIAQTETELRANLQQFLTSYASSNEQQVAIQKDFADKRAALDSQYNDKRSAGYVAALGIINKAEQQALQEHQQRKLEETEEYKKTTRVILEEGQKGLKIQIDNQRAVVERAKALFGENSEVFKRAQKDLNDLEKRYSEGLLSNITQYAQLIGQFGQVLVEMGGQAAQSGQALISLSQQIPLVAGAFKAGITDAEKYSIAIQGVIGLFSSITNAAAQRKKAETDYYAAVIAQQQQYNLLLNEQLGTQAKSKENIFVKDYVGELSDGFKQFDDAQVKYQESLARLSQGRAKAGLQGSFDSANFLQSVGSAAATGAAIGSIVPGIGTAVGAVVGGIVGGIAGFFSSNKKVDEFSNLLNLYPNLIQKTANGVSELNTNLAESLIAQGLVDDQTKALLQSTIEWQKQVEAAREAIKGIISDLAGSLGDKLRDNLVGAFRDGTDAAVAFKSAVSGILEDLVTKMLFSKAFNSLFTQLEKDLTNSLDTTAGGDGNTIDDFQRFTENSKDALDQYNLWLQQFQDAAKASGFDVLAPSGSAGSTKNPNSMSQAIQGVSQETASLIAGQLNAMRMGQAETTGLVRQQVALLSGIKQDTGRTAENSEYLKSIDRRLQNIESDPMRGIGGGVK